MNDSAQPVLIIPDDVLATTIATQGELVERLSGIDREKAAADVLSETKAHQQAAVLQRFAQLRGSRLLEVGSGLAANLIVWTKCYGADVAGIEPDGVGFDASYRLGCAMMEANGLDPKKIFNAVGEHLPFPDNSFDIVFSTNVLEHTDRPAQVLAEAVRVLRPGGILQFVYPNYTSYYDGHYGVFHPPVIWRGFFPWYVRWICRRDPAFAHTLRTELNPSWTRKQLRALKNVEILDLGADLFLQRMTTLDFSAWASLIHVKRLLVLIASPRIRRLLGRIAIALNGWTPIVLTLRKTD